MASVSLGSGFPGNAGFGGRLEWPRPIPGAWYGFLGPSSEIGSAGTIGAGVLRANACGGLGGSEEDDAGAAGGVDEGAVNEETGAGSLACVDTFLLMASGSGDEQAAKLLRERSVMVVVASGGGGGALLATKCDLAGHLFYLTSGQIFLAGSITARGSCCHGEETMKAQVDGDRF